MTFPCFVAGATGYTGREVVRQLGGRGLPVVAHVRADSPRLTEWTRRFEAMGAAVDATVWDRAAMTKTMRRLRPAVVFALLGTVRSRMRRARREGRDPQRESYEAVDYGLTARLHAACVEAGIRPRFVYLSAAGVSDRASRGYYGARAKVERMLREGPLPWAIARPSFITGPDRDDARWGERRGAALVDFLLNTVGRVGLERFRDRYRSTSNRVLAANLIRIAQLPESNRVYEGESLRVPPGGTWT